MYPTTKALWEADNISDEERKVIGYYACDGGNTPKFLKLAAILIATKNASDTAIAQTTNNFDAEYMTRGDSFRHSLWNALLTKSVQNSFDNLWDPDQATQMGAIQYALNFTFAHEAGRYREAFEAGALPGALENLNNDNEMDRHNNIEGLRFALYDFCTQNGDGFNCQDDAVAISYLKEMAMGKYSARWVDGSESYPTVASTMKEFDNSFVFTTCHAFDDGGDCDRDLLYDVWTPGGTPFGIRAPDKCVHLPAPIWQLNHMFDRNCDSNFDSWVFELLPPTVGIFPPDALDNTASKSVDFITITDSGEVVVLKKNVRPDTYNVIVQDSVFRTIEKRVNGFVLVNDETGVELPVYNYSEQFIGGSSAVINGYIYIINESANALLALVPEREDASQIIIGYTTYSINNLPLLTEREIHNINGNLYLTGYSNNALNIYRFDTNEFIFTTSIPLKRRAYNIAVFGESLYIVDGVAIDQNGEHYYDQSKMTDNGGEFVAGVMFNTTNNETELIETQSRVTTSVAKMKLIGNTLHLAYRLDFDSNSYLEENVDTQSGLISYQYYTIDEEYCLSQNGSTVSGGYLQEDVCQPFGEKNHSFYQINAAVNDVAGYNKYLYLSFDNAVKVVDISNPESISEVLNIPTDFVVYDIDIKGNTAFVTVRNGVASYDISDVNNIVLQDYLITYDTENFLYSSSGAVTDSYGEVVHASGELDDTTELVIEGDILYAADGHGVTVIDISNPTSLVVINDVYTSGNTETIAVTDSKIYAYDRYSLKIYDKTTLNQVYSDYLDEDEWGSTEDEPCENARFRAEGNTVYADCFLSSSVYTIEQSGYSYDFNSLNGDRVELGDVYLYSQFGYMADGTGVRVSSF